MEINIKNEKLPVCSAVCNLKNNFSTECDVIVPDAKPDISRILQVSARARITGCETQTDRVILSGTVFFNIIYLADNEEKSVKSIDASCAFSNLFQGSGIREDMLTISDIDVSEVSYRLANCRKLTVKGILMGCVSVYSCTEATFISEIEGACTKSEALSSTVICAHAEGGTSVSDSFELSQSKCEIREILNSEAKISDSDIKIIDDKAIIKGTVCATTLYIGERGLDFIESELPFAHVLDVEGLRNDMLTSFDAKLTDISTSAAPDANGEIRVLNINADVFFRVTARKTINASCITDAYMPRANLELEKKRISVSGIESTLHNEADIRESITLPEGLPPIDTVYKIIARPFCEKSEISGDKLSISGYSEIYILYFSTDELSPVYSYKTNVDFSVMSDCSDCTLVPVSECKMRNVSYVINGEREVEVRSAINISTRCMRESSAEVVTEAKEGVYSPAKRPSIILSFMPYDGSLWETAKEYNISEEDILRANALESENDIKSGCALIIPK